MSFTHLTLGPGGITLPSFSGPLLFPGASEITIDNSRAQGALTFQLGIGWPPRFDDFPVIALQGGQTYGPSQRRFDAIRFVGVNGPTDVEVVTPDAVGPTYVTPY